MENVRVQHDADNAMWEKGKGGNYMYAGGLDVGLGLGLRLGPG